MRTSWTLRLVIGVACLIGLKRTIQPHVDFYWVQRFRGPQPKRIFFIETNPQTTHVSLMAHCAVESAARKNPDFLVTFIVDERCRHMKIGSTMGLHNIEYVILNTTEAFENSILSSIAANIDNATSHQLYTVSDLLRMVLLYHLGGVYLDHDVISIRAIPEQFSNFAPMIRAKEKWWLTSCLLRFRKPQNLLLANILKEVPLVIDTAKRGELDFKLVTRVAERFCQLTNSTGGGKYFQCPRAFQFHSFTSKSGFMGQGLWWCRLKQLRQLTENHPNFKNLFAIHFNDFKNVFHNNASYLLGLDDLSYTMRAHCPVTYKNIQRISH